jgi:hypothetical protein
MTRTLYLKHEQIWVGVDQQPNDCSDIDRSLYEDVKLFLQNYFCSEEEDEKWVSSIDNGLTRDHGRNGRSGSHEEHFENVRAIPGGRYGCAQFVKICGPE